MLLKLSFGSNVIISLGLQPRLAQWLMRPREQAYLLIKLFLILIHGCSQVEGAFLVINAWITPYLHCTHLRHIMAPTATGAERGHSIQYLSLYQPSHGTFQKCPRSASLQCFAKRTRLRFLQLRIM